VSAWQNRFGGIFWRTTPEGVEIRGEGIQRTPGAPITMLRVWVLWGELLERAVKETGVPMELLLMTVGTEAGPLRLQPDGRLTYTALRQEPGYRSDDETPGRISFGPCHVTLESYRNHMRRGAPRGEAMVLENNLLAAARYLADRRHRHGYDPILAAADYNAGSVRAAPPGSRFHNRWGIACHVDGTYVHLDRAAKWYGDACHVLRTYSPRPPQLVEWAT